MQWPAHQPVTGLPPTAPTSARRNEGRPKKARTTAVVNGEASGDPWQSCGAKRGLKAYFAGGRGGASSSTGVVSSCSTLPSACVMETPIHLRRTSL